ncbi:MAG TPA: penicillin acylase family protein [Fibrobacteria bacterium]|nr:penicillin acylase family protein [Fibrobacteria bacterium]
MRRFLAGAARFFPALFVNGLPHLLRFAALPGRLRGPRRTLRERLADFPVHDLPLQGAVRVRFDDRQIPFVEGDSDRDVAFALGMVHAHLRLGQMEITRRLARGRLAELLGPSAVKLDHSLRSLALGEAVPAMLASLPPETAVWLEGYAAGVSAYQRRMRTRPLEFILLRIPKADWTVEDVLMVSRLAGADVNWVMWLDILGLRRAYAWRVVWGKILDLGFASPASFTPEGWDAYLPRLLGSVIRSGSNSFAASSGPGKAWLASDPHLSVIFPNVWMLAGYRSPSYHAVGFMLPGLPFTALGRNPAVAWGATNMYAASSDLVDVSSLPEAAFTVRREVIRVRGWFPQEIALRSTAYGPVISDAPFLERYRGPAISLRWMGHRPSDEISAFLGASRARDWEGFRAAFRTYAVSGMNVVYADAGGTVGQLMAVRLPMRGPGAPPDLLTQPADSDRAWASLADSSALPHWSNPPGGFVVSANNLPAPTGFPVGYLFPPGDRHKRIRALLEGGREVTLDRLKAIQADVHSSSCDRVRSLLSARIALTGAAGEGKGVRGMLRCLSEWDGDYRAVSRGAAAFQLIVHSFAVPYLESGYGGALTGYLLASEAFYRVLEEELAREPGHALLQALELGVRRAYRQWRKYPTWGILHRLRPAHPLRLLPVVGRLFVLGDAAADGSSQTVQKTAHPVTGRPHAVTYGAVARHISDLSDPDGNHFALLGGQDGWLLSENSMDLWDKWRKREYVRIPLLPDSVAGAFPHVLVLEPSRSADPPGVTEGIPSAGEASGRPGQGPG